MGKKAKQEIVTPAKVEAVIKKKVKVNETVAQTQ